jgi:lysophospholipase L1-like esterase
MVTGDSSGKKAVTSQIARVRCCETSRDYASIPVSISQLVVLQEMRANDTLRLSSSTCTAIAIVVLATFAPSQSCAGAQGAVTIAADTPAIQFSGRSEGVGTATVTFGWSGDRVRLRFRGSSSVGVFLNDDSGENYAMAWVERQPGRKFRLNARDGFYPVAEGLDDGEHTVEVVRVTECNFGLTHFRGFALDRGAEVLEWRSAHDRKIEFIGDSITCGYGVEVDDPELHFEPATENFCLGYSALTARRLDADYVVVARSGIGMLRNYDGPRDGSEGAMPQVYPHTFFIPPAKDWDYSRFTPDVVCLNLGTNDFSTTGVNVEKFITAYSKFLGMLLERYPDAKIVVLQGPMENSGELDEALGEAVSRQGESGSKRVHRFALSPQGALGHGADYHPNRAQSAVSADELTAFLSELMNWR